MPVFPLLTSPENPAVKLAVKLRLSAAARRENALFFAEGARLCADAAQSGLAADTCFFTPTAQEKYPQECLLAAGRAGRCFEISERVARKLSDTETPQGVFCLFPPVPQGNSFSPDGRYLALENVCDPANLGACARTAEALGIAGLILSPGCCDPYNPKALRASMGAFFRLPLFRPQELSAFLLACKESGVPLYGSVPDSSAVSVSDLPKGGCICLVGNEGNGLTEEAKALCSRFITIPMRGRAESLNAAAAAAILMWELTKS